MSACVVQNASTYEPILLIAHLSSVSAQYSNDIAAVDLLVASVQYTLFPLPLSCNCADNSYIGWSDG